MFDINIVIVTYKMKADLAKCFDSFLPDLPDPNINVNVTVVDNASGDGLGDWLKEKYPNVKFILQPGNVGFGKSQNAGIQAAEAKYYFVLNPDTYFFPGQNTIKRLYDFMDAHPKIGMIGPKMIYPDGSLQHSCYRFPTFWQPLYSRTVLGAREKGQGKKGKFLMKDFDHNKTQPVDWIMGSAMFVRGEAVAQVGGFDDSFFMYYEDSDWCRRFWEAGWPVYYVHDIVIEHRHGRGSAKVSGILKALIKNRLARVHLTSWLKYMWKWRGNYRYYAS